MIVGYARCSTYSQADGLDGQIAYLREKMGAEVIYSEIVSGRKTEREELAKLLSFVRPGDVIAIQRLDRLARSVQELIRLVQEFSSRKVDLRSGHETIDTATASGRLVFHVFCALAEFEANLIKERTLIGLEHARRKGRIGGRPRKLDSTELGIIRAVMAEGVVPVRVLAKKYNVAVSTLYSSLRRESSFLDA